MLMKNFSSSSRKVRICGLLVSGALVASAVLAAEWPSSSGAASVAAANDAVNLAAFSKPQLATDALPGSVSVNAIASSPIDTSSLRKLATIGGHSHYVAKDALGEICLITALNDAAGVAASSCVSPASFVKEGAVLAVNSPSDSEESYLLPDGYASALAGSSDYSVVAANLVLVNDASIAHATVQLSGPDGDVAFAPLATHK